MLNSFDLIWCSQMCGMGEMLLISENLVPKVIFILINSCCLSSILKGDSAVDFLVETGLFSSSMSLLW